MNKALSPLFHLSLCTLGCLYASSTQAQVIPDDTVNTKVTPNVNVAEIRGGETRGGNLFHSFQEFSVGTGNEAFFNNATDISNIFSRVTGGKISSIDGLVRANGSANLFLINPAGIIFGQNARLDLGGSFYGSTADSILFEDGEFSATDLNNSPVLTINAPIGLDFRDNPGDIAVIGNGQGTRTTDNLIDTQDALRVNSNKTFSLLGRDLLFVGATIKTAGGRIEFGSMEGNQQVSLTPVSEGFSLGYEGVQNFRDIQLSQTATVDASGKGGGNIRVQGRNITLKDSSTIEATTLGSMPGGNLDITASKLLEVSDHPTIDGDITGIFAQVDTDAEGDSGKLNIESDRIELKGADVRVGITTFGDGDGADLVISTKQLQIKDGAELQAITLGNGNAGNIDISDSELIQIGGTQKKEFTTRNDNGDSVTIPNAKFGGIFANAIGGGKGDAGNLKITTDKLIVQDFGTVSGSNFQTFNLLSPGKGAAGNLEINANSIDVNNGTITADNANGVGGELEINTNSLTLENGASISAETTSDTGRGGNIDLIVDGNIEMLDNSLISGRAIEGAEGGNLKIDARFIVAYPSSGTGNDLVATADTGKGGNIDLNVEQYFGLQSRNAIDNNNNQINNNSNDLDASSNVLGLDGTVNINSSRIDPLQGATELPSNVVESEQITSQQACQANGESNTTSGLNIKGKDGVTPAPDLPLNSQNIIGDETNSAYNIPEPIETSQGKIQPARGIKVTKDGRVILTAYRTNNAGERIPEIKPNCSNALTSLE